MASFSQISQDRLDSCDPRLRALFAEVVKNYDCTVIYGYRGEAEQNDAFRLGRSTKQFPNSKHNQSPSLAVDVAPYPVDWNDLKRFYHFAGFVKGVAKNMGIPIRWGGDWDADNDFKDQRFNDLPHFEIAE